MKNRVLAVLLVVVMAMSFAACSSGPGQKTKNTETTDGLRVSGTQRDGTGGNTGTIKGTNGQTGSQPNADENKGKVVIKDQLGKTIEFDSPPERLATTIMPFPYIFHAVMGNNDHMIGCNPSSMKAYHDSALKYMYPKMEKADTSWVDTGFIVNVEELLKLKPDVVFQWTSKPQEIEKMEAAGLKVIALRYGTIDDLETWIRIISSLYQNEARGEELISYFHKSVDEVRKKLATVDNLPTIIQLTNNLKVAGKGFTNYWVEQSGAVNPAKDLSGDERKINMEQMLKWNPDILYIGNFTDMQPSDILENKIDGQDWSLIKAVQNRQVYKIPIGGYRWDPPGVETPLMIKWLAKIQHPTIFADMDMREEVKKFYHDVYNFDLTDDMLKEILDDTQN